jgi:RimJ/RimL family protein N-acetyltransferase
MKCILETERLRLRQLDNGDAAFIFELVNSPGWLEFIGDRHVRTVSDAVDYIQNGPVKSYAAHGFGLSVVELKTDGTPIGLCGLLKRDYLDHPDIGFAFLPDFMGQGYACEIASATIAHANETLNIPIILAIVMPTNERSIRLLEKVGMTFHQTLVSPTDQTELLLYRRISATV